ncbi:MAG: prolipoprotein diacylglyceryl transferase [Rhodospirillaceae bacterium]|nr:prolipoprotein diacylglyceryl transferase [Rhodospirillaceae bacterium]
MFFALAFPLIDPVLIEIGPIAIRWYSLAYIAGLLMGWRLMVWMAAQPPKIIKQDDVDDFLVWAVLAVMLGGRIGYVLFYNFGYYSANPSEILLIWQGGMSFHGGLLGVIIATFWFCRQRSINTLSFFDLLGVATPIGLFFGRIANFINSELYGRPTDVAWGMVFPTGGPLARHPSQLYEAMLEGLVLFVIVLVLWRREAIRKRPGLVAGVFLIGYSSARAFVELFRQPDQHIGFLAGGTTMGQMLSLPMWIIGGWLIWSALKASSDSTKKT